MNDPKDKSPERLEKLLRIWGAEQAVAAEEADLGNPPVPAPTHRPWLARWSPLIAAAGLVLCGVGVAFFLASRTHSTPPSTGVVDKATSQPDTASQELRQTNANLAARMTDLKEELAQRTNQAGQWIRRNDELSQQLADREGQLLKATTQLDQTIASLMDSQAAAILLRQDNRQLLAATTQASVTLADARGHIDKLDRQLRSQRPIVLQEFQAVYLGGADTVAARQQAARRNRLIERHVDVRKSVKDEDVGRLADSLEIWLTRLDQVDTQNASGISGLARAAGAENLAEKIDKVLLAGDQPIDAKFKAWLLECELVFLGIGGAS